MKHWNYRVVELPEGDGTTLMVCEVFYSSAGKPMLRNEGARVFGATQEELLQGLQRIRDALDKPILKDSEIGDTHP